MLLYEFHPCLLCPGVGLGVWGFRPVFRIDPKIRKESNREKTTPAVQGLSSSRTLGSEMCLRPELLNIEGTLHTADPRENDP